MRTTRTLRVAGTALALALVATACGGDDDTASTTSEAPSEDMSASEPASDSASEASPSDAGSEIAAPPTINEGTLTICSDVPYAPFEVEDAESPSGYSGFDIDLVQAMVDEVGLELQVQVTAFDAIQSGTALAANTCDMAASAMTITEEREENVDFLDPYFDADQSLLVEQDGPQSLDDVSALGVQTGTTGEAYAQENYDGELTSFDGAASLFAALAAGSIDGILQDLPVNAERANAEDSLSVVDTYPTGEQYGFAVSEGNTELADPLNAALQSVRDSGTYDEIYAEYFDTEA